MSFLDKAIRVLKLAAAIVVDVFYGIPKRILEKMVFNTVELETSCDIASTRFILDYLKLLAVSLIVSVFAVPFVEIYLACVFIGIAAEFIHEALYVMIGSYKSKRTNKTENEGSTASESEATPA